MTTHWLFLCALLVSLAGFVYLAVTDPKRRRVSKTARPLSVPRVASLGWLCVVLPGIPLLALGEISAFVSWLGAITVGGWLLVVVLFRDPASKSH